ncbi:MAG: hypothetical protein ACREOW_01155 [Thermodesulfobacteriota bacterium]
MRHLILVSLIIFPLFILACIEDVIPASGDVDSLITEEEALSQEYNRTTPFYDMQVSIRSDVNADIDKILDSLDERAADFLECQFMMGTVIGSQPFLIPNGDEVTPLSMLRVFVVPNSFECTAVDKNICAGIYYYPDTDIIIIANEGLGRCGNLPLWKHEVGHRYGMAPDHSNQNDFEPCIDPPDCDTIDLPDIFTNE